MFPIQRQRAMAGIIAGLPFLIWDIFHEKQPKRPGNSRK